MEWLASLIPGTLGVLGSICLGLAVVLILVDMEGGADWAKIGAWCAGVGGFGALGAAGGWVGSHIATWQSGAMDWAQRWGQQAIGGGVVIVILVGAGLWFWKHASSRGTAAGGKGKVSKRVRALFKAALFALIGATVATVIPGAHGWVADTYSTVASGAQNLIA